MNYYQPREIRRDGEGTGRWHYTCQNDGRIWPVGYCREHEGHESPEAAIACYRSYQLDHRLKLDGTWKEHYRHCQAPGCETLTNHFASLDHGSSWALCDEHRTRETVEQLYPEGPAQIISSW